MPAVILLVMWAIPGRPLDVAICGGELQQRVIRVDRHGKRIGAAEQDLAIEKLRRGCDRPFALCQAKGGVLFDDVSLPGVDFQALPDGVLRALTLLRGIEDTGNLRQSRCRILNGGCIDGRGPAYSESP